MTPDEIEITIAILKALNLVDQMNGSISDFEDVLQFAKELYCRNDSDLEGKGRPCALDPFLHPLISDVENIFINGMNSSEVLTGYLCLQKFKSGHTAVITI